MASALADSAGASPLPGIAYDEIARVIQTGATPPPLGSFGADAAVIDALPPLVVPKKEALNFSALSLLGVIPYVGSWAAQAVAQAEVAARDARAKKQEDEFVKGTAVRQRTGVLAHFAFYRGWSRVAFTPAFTTIEKPDQGVTIALDNSAKTYQTIHSTPNVETYTVQSGAAAVAEPTVNGAPSVEPLLATRIDGVLAHGYRTTGAIEVMRGTFFCSAGEHQVVETEYVSDMADPRYDASQDSSDAKPLVSACTVGNAVSHRAPGHLVLYRVVTVDQGTPTAFSVALERGNIRFIGEQDATFFLPPADFKEAP